jgi:Leucine-rich repeat (LRR) protein
MVTNKIFCKKMKCFSYHCNPLHKSYYMKTKLLLFILLLSLITKAQTNLVSNGDFEDWSSSTQPDNWFSYFSGEASQSATAQNGVSSVRMKILDGTINFINTEFFPVIANKTYRVTAYHKVVSGTFTSLDFSLYHKPSTFKEEIAKKTDVTFSSTAWTKIEFDYTPTVSENIEVDVLTNGALNSEILIDNVSVIDVAEIGATYTLIPDANFEAKLIALGHDDVADGKVLTSKIAVVKSLKVDPELVADLTGIQDFAALEELDCSNGCISSSGGGCGKITNLDVSKNPLLITLYCQGNKLTNLDVTKNTQLRNFRCQANKLTSLDITNNTNLGLLDFSNNALTEFDSSKNPLLGYVVCYQNKLNSLDFANNTNLYHINCGSNEISSLDISKLNSLEFLDVQRNKIKELDIANKTRLYSLDCSSNLITSLDVSLLTNLTELRCTENKLTSLDVTQNTKLTYLYCGSNTIDIFDITKNHKLVELECATLLLNDLDVTKLTELKKLTADANNLKTIDVSNNLKLTDLSLSKNQFTDIDITKNILLKTLYVSDNKLSTLNPANNTDLQAIICINNLLTNIDISNNKKLNYINCNNNKLTFLNLKNGKKDLWIDLTTANYKNNPDLKCIQVTDAKYAKERWSDFADPNVRFSEDCGGPLEVSSNNFVIETKGESCLGENNGEINITAKETFSYVASVNGQSKTFVGNTLNLSGLASGNYTILITIPGENYEQNFNLVIAKGVTVTGKSSISSKKINVEITDGTAPYTVFVNGIEQFETNTSSFSITAKGTGLLEVKTAKACEGIYVADIASLDLAIGAYPNPTSGSFEIELPIANKEVTIEINTLDGRLISNKKYSIENGTAQLTLENEPNGVYIAKIYLDTIKNVKIIKN